MLSAQMDTQEATSAAMLRLMGYRPSKLFEPKSDHERHALGMIAPHFSSEENALSWMSAFEVRGVFTKLYAWAIPSDAALERIASYGPIIEIGAGTGFWSAMLAARGTDVIAFDQAPLPENVPETMCDLLKSEAEADAAINPWHVGQSSKGPVLRGSAAEASLYPERALMLCWPPYNTSFAYDALVDYAGDTVIYIGEHSGGCCATDEFFSLLCEKFDEVECVAIPQWPGIHDDITIWKRKAAT